MARLCCGSLPCCWMCRSTSGSSSWRLVASSAPVRLQNLGQRLPAVIHPSLHAGNQLSAIDEIKLQRQNAKEQVAVSLGTWPRDRLRMLMWHNSLHDQ